MTVSWWCADVATSSLPFPSLLYFLSMHPEQSQHHEIEPHLLAAFISTFILRQDAYARQQVDGTYVAVRKPLTSALLEQHFNGRVTLGTYALDAMSMARWICLDADTDTQAIRLLEMTERITEAGIPFYRERSRRGFHLWFFFQQPLTGILARRFIQQLLVEHGVDAKQCGDKPLEIYPRQVQLVGDGLGSLVRLPLGVHRKTGKIYPFVDQNDKPLANTPRELLPIVSKPDYVPLPSLLAVISRSSQPVVEQPTPAFRTNPLANLKDRQPSERILAAISTLDFVREYVALDAYHRGHCPFHDDEHKSFNVVESGNYWNCFAGCGGGNLIHFWSKWRAEHGQDGSFVDTVRDLLHILNI
ncbi:MAG: hypothetical protein JNJ61_20590 [Anaerolineae bacterium]|nr:hypothetical protein [Anaerolineae bacterium]